MDLTVTDLKQAAILKANGTSTDYVADRSYATIPVINLRVTNHLLIGAALGMIAFKLLE